MASRSMSEVLRHIRMLAEAKALSHLPDRQLLQRFAADGDEAAFGELVRRHGPVVLEVCRSVLQNWHDAEDAFQAVFLVLARKAGSIRKQESVGSWLFGVASRVAQRAKADAARQRAHEARCPETPPADPADDITWRELRAVLHEELGRLPEKFRAPLVLCYLEGRTQAEAARQLGWSLGTLRRRLERGRGVLSSRLGRRGFAPSAALGAVLVSHGLARASVPAAVTQATVAAALPFAAGQTAAGAVPTRAVVLANGMLQAMFATKVKTGAGALLVLTILAAGAGLAAHQGQAVKRPEAKHAGEPRPAAGHGEQSSAEGKEVHTDRYGDPLPPGAVARLGSLRFYHGEQVDRVALSPDGKLVASWSVGAHPGDAGGNRLWDAVTGRELPLRDELRSRATTFFPAGGKLVGVERWQGHVRLWDAAAGKELGQLTPGSDVSWFSLAPDGRTLAVWDLELPDVRSTLRFWHVTTKKSAEPIVLEHNAQVLEFAFSADSKTLVTLHNNHTIHVWDVPTHTERRASRASQADYSGFIALSPDGKVVATAPYAGKRIRLWDARTLKELPPLRNQPDMVVQPMTFSPDSKLLAVTYPSPNVYLWDLAKRKKVRQVRGKDFQVFRTVFSADGKTLAGADGSSATLWDVATGKFRHNFGHTYYVAGLNFSPDGKTLVSGAGYNDTAIRVWDPRTGRQTGQWQGHTAGIQAMDYSADGKVVASGSQDGTVRLWDAATGKELRRLDAKDGMVYGLAFAPDGKTLASGGGRKAIHLWDVATGREVRAFNNPGDFVSQVAFAPDGKTLATQGSGEGVIRLWDVTSGKEVRQLRGHQAGCPSFSPDGKQLAGTGNGSIHLWDVATGAERRALGRPARQGQKQAFEVFTLVFSPDGRTLAAGYRDRTVCLWELASGQQRATFKGHRAEVSALAFSPDGCLLASGSWDRTIVVWDVKGRGAAGRQQPGNLAARQLEALWADLGDTDASKAYRALQALLGVGKQAVPLLRERVRPAAAGDGTRIEQLIADLDDRRFAVRQRASQHLEQLGELAEPGLRRVLKGQSTPEGRRRAEQILTKLAVPSPETLRALRAVEVLEDLGTPAAQQVLRELAQGVPGARLTQEAQASLERLARRGAARR